MITFLTLLVVALVTVGCGGVADESDRSSAPYAPGDPKQASADPPPPSGVEQAASAELTRTAEGCQSTVAGAWTNAALSPQSSTYTASFAATPRASALVAVIGFSNGPADAFADLAAAVRFNASGTVDVRSGAAYKADRSYAYVAGAPVYFFMEVNVPARTYSVWVGSSPDERRQLASNYAFRSEQATVTALNQQAAVVVNAGAVDICAFQLGTPATCAATSQASGWQNSNVVVRGPAFSVEFDATPSAIGIEGVVGLSDGPAAAYADLAAVARFNPSGTIDARSGNAYRADQVVRYVGGSTYRLKLDVNVATHTYSVTVTPPGGTAIVLARDYAFRTEQSGVQQLNNAARNVSTVAGTLSVCSLSMSYPETDSCPKVSSAQGFSNAAVESQDALVVTSFRAWPSTTAMDAVIGMSSGPANAFTDLAAAVRFNPLSYIDVRDGDSYRADRVVQYEPGYEYEVKMIVNVRNKTYSVWVHAPQVSDTFTEIAHEFAFRSEQRAVATLDNLAQRVTSGGQLAVCDTAADTSTGIAFARAGKYGVTELPDGRLLGSDGSILNARGELLGQAPVGAITVGRDGFLYRVESFSDTLDWGTGPLVSAGERDVAIAKYDTSFNLIWAKQYGTAADELASSINADAAGQLLLSYSLASGADVTVRASQLQKIAASGEVLWSMAQPDGLLAPDPYGGFAVVAKGMDTIRVQRHDASGALLWSRQLPVRAELEFAGADSTGIVFAGTYSGTVNFGGEDFSWESAAAPNDAYLVKLALTDGSHVYSRSIGLEQLTGFDINARDEVVVAGVQIVYPIFFHFGQFDAAGNSVRSDLDYDIGMGQVGWSKDISLGESGRIYWNLEPEARSTAMPYFLALGP
jgi:hypothetical protein